MARRPVLEIDGVTYKNVYEITYEIKTPYDETGRPSDIARMGLIKVLRESDSSGDIARWAAGGGLDLKSGNIYIKYYDDQKTKKISFEKGFVARYEERVPNTKSKRDDQVMEYFEISCSRIVVDDKGTEIYSQWTESTGSGD
ncbi:MAG: hypothetical protein JSV52_01100 [Candidatus Zixiibacteriota bacterium]|nr:MAG: hypothetical protein JSV52_01100 [candidate division Zixibacteria bacterium]